MFLRLCLFLQLQILTSQLEHLPTIFVFPHLHNLLALWSLFELLGRLLLFGGVLVLLHLIHDLLRLVIHPLGLPINAPCLVVKFPFKSLLILEVLFAGSA